MSCYSDIDQLALQKLFWHFVEISILSSASCNLIIRAFMWT